MKLTQVEIIKETCRYYAADPRRRAITLESHCSSAGNCKYQTAGVRPKRCAVGRCFRRKVLENRQVLSFQGTLGLFLRVVLCNHYDWFISLGYIGDRWGTGRPPKAVYSVADMQVALDTLLQPRYRGHSISFWTALQSLHDNACYWNKHGLTDNGQEYYEHLLNQYQD